jgi:hypothetical protein
MAMDLKTKGRRLNARKWGRNETGMSLQISEMQRLIRAPAE